MYRLELKVARSGGLVRPFITFLDEYDGSAAIIRIM